MQSKTKFSINNLPVYEIKGDHSSRGCEAFFYRMGKSKYGIKLYKNFDIALESYNRQKIASKHRLGPKTGKFIMARKSGKKTIYFGYETQKIEEFDLDNPKHIEIFEEQKDELYEKLYNLGLSGDFSETNCGILNGILMAVDFGSHSESY